jgi:hypothetical protein
MLELLLYCQMVARLRYADEIMLVMDFIGDFLSDFPGDLKARCRRLVAPAVAARREPVCPFGFWTEHSLDRLDAYVGSVA